MLKKMMTIAAGAVISVTVGTTVQAETITVQKGDTLWSLSQSNHTSVENIQNLNQLSTDIIHPGDELTIMPEKQYTVQKGDTLYAIAKTHEVTVSQIKDWNQLHTDLIHPGQNLLVGGSSNQTHTASSVNAAPAPATTTSKPSAKELTVEATAYTASCEGCSGITATGIDLKANPNQKVIAVDPSIIPLGSKVYVEGYGEAIAGDVGGAIKGNKIDVFIPSKQDAIEFGVQQLKVTVLN